MSCSVPMMPSGLVSVPTGSAIGEASTANGIVRIARVTLSDVRLGEVAESRLPAYVTDGAMEVSLLGPCDSAKEGNRKETPL